MFIGCGDGGGNDGSCQPGTLYCACLNGVCQAGLACDGTWCVDPNSGVTLSTTGPGDGDPGDGDPGDGDGDGDPGDGDPGDGDGDGDPGDGDPGDGDGDGDGDPVTEIVVGGQVVDFFTAVGIEGADISVEDMPGFETVSDVGGSYEIANLPGNTEVFFLVDGNEAEYWGGITPANLPGADIDDLELGQISNQLLDAQILLLQQQDPNVMADESKAMVVVRLLQPMAVGATVTMSPPPAAGTYYGVDMNNSPILNGNLIGSELLPMWIAFNLEPDEVGGAYEITVDHPQRECTVIHSVFPTRARCATFIDVDCPP